MAPIQIFKSNPKCSGLVSISIAKGEFTDDMCLNFYFGPGPNEYRSINVNDAAILRDALNEFVKTKTVTTTTNSFAVYGV